VTIAPGATLPEHLHEGTRVAHIVAGVLTYDVVSGQATVTHSNGKTQTVTAPATIKLRRGDDLVETSDGGETSFAATMGVVGGTGRYASATGAGTFTGSGRRRWGRPWRPRSTSTSAGAS
jgi:hypothetical protein